MDAKQAVEIRTVRQNYYDEITADGNCDRCCRVCIECGHNNEKQRAETEQFWKDVNVQTCREHFEVIKTQADKIEQQSREITDLRQRLREFGEKIQTQALVLDARDKIIVRQGQEMGRQGKIIEIAIARLRKGECPIFITKKCLDPKNPMGDCPDDKCWRRWLEQEAQP